MVRFAAAEEEDDEGSWDEDDNIMSLFMSSNHQDSTSRVAAPMAATAAEAEAVADLIAS